MSSMPDPDLQRSFRKILFGAVLLVLTLGAALPAGDEVRVSLAAVGDGLPKEGVGQGRIEAPPERVFRAVSDLEHWHEFMPFLEASDAKRMRDGSVESFQRLDLPFPMGRKTYRIRFRTRMERTAAGNVWHADWSYVPGSGNIRDHRGSWTLVPAGTAGDATLATCRLYTHPGGMAPAGAMDRATEKSLAWIFKSLRQHVRRSRYAGPAPGL